MTEHVHDLKVMLSISKNIYAVCPQCDECMDKEEIETRLNATERLSAEDARRISNRKLPVSEHEELQAYADILEGK